MACGVALCCARQRRLMLMPLHTRSSQACYTAAAGATHSLVSLLRVLHEAGSVPVSLFSLKDL
jgi:hypothetical protein